MFRYSVPICWLIIYFLQKLWCSAPTIRSDRVALTFVVINSISIIKGAEHRNINMIVTRVIISLFHKKGSITPILFNNIELKFLYIVFLFSSPLGRLGGASHYFTNLLIALNSSVPAFRASSNRIDSYEVIKTPSCCIRIRANSLFVSVRELMQSATTTG